MQIYNSNFLEIRYDVNTGILWDKWSVDTAKMADGEFEKEITQWKNAIISQKAKLAMIDATDMAFSIAPSVQEWVNINITAPTIQAGLQRMAFIVSQEFFTQLSIELTMDENADKTLQVQYFTNESEASIWLLKK